MTTRTLSVVSFLLLSGLSVSTLRAQTPSFTVQLYNHAGAPLELIEEAAEVAAGIFEQSDLAMDWTLCPKPAANRGGPSCDVFGKSVLRVNVLDREKADRLGTAPEAFGVAFPDKKGYGVMATVFHHRVAELERDTDVEGAVVLGHILAHEIGHLLLGFRSHTQSGIMTADWDELQILRMEQDDFGFHAGQARKMRKQVFERNAADEAIETAEVAADGNAGA